MFQYRWTCVSQFYPVGLVLEIKLTAIHLSMAASFYSSPLIGATTTLACFAHEIPHEIADYSILIRSGFTKRQAMQSQFITAIGAFVGLIGIRPDSSEYSPVLVFTFRRIE